MVIVIDIENDLDGVVIIYVAVNRPAVIVDVMLCYYDTAMLLCVIVVVIVLVVAATFFAIAAVLADDDVSAAVFLYFFMCLCPGVFGTDAIVANVVVCVCVVWCFCQEA